jgi:riboflavin synthase
MFTGIIEALGSVVAVSKEGFNLRITLSASFAGELKVDQSVAHNGICLTVVAINGSYYEVVAVDETVKRTNISDWRTGTKVNLERCMKIGDRLDGHIVQGHVDATAVVSRVEEKMGSWEFAFRYEKAPGHITVEKGSICINGVSLTVVDSYDDSFSVAIIPYTFEHTNFHSLNVGDKVNLEFDVIGKYVARLVSVQR